MPIEFKCFAHNFLKLNEFEETDSLAQLNSKIEKNLQILSQVYSINISQIKLSEYNTDTAILPHRLISYYSNLKSTLSFFVDVLN